MTISSFLSIRHPNTVGLKYHLEATPQQISDSFLHPDDPLLMMSGQDHIEICTQYVQTLSQALLEVRQATGTDFNSRTIVELFLPANYNRFRDLFDDKITPETEGALNAVLTLLGEDGPDRRRMSEDLIDQATWRQPFILVMTAEGCAQGQLPQKLETQEVKDLLGSDIVHKVMQDNVTFWRQDTVLWYNQTRLLLEVVVLLAAWMRFLDLIEFSKKEIASVGDIANLSRYAREEALFALEPTILLAIQGYLDTLTSDVPMANYNYESPVKLHEGAWEISKTLLKQADIDAMLKEMDPRVDT
ncbi:hypothetical protein ACQU0X_27175 [Pseudovibrio ascidiaceicola]|uniref:hypothetical protein n=1 Tax=Pseudovibrio ascidiaceicola TaxID=285279 RepID=UPI003D366C1D